MRSRRAVLAFFGWLALITQTACGGLTRTLPATEEKELGRMANVPHPRIAMLWSPVRGDDSLASYARHDLILLGTWWLGLEPDRQPVGLADGFTPESVKAAKKRLAELRQANHHAVVLVELYFYEYNDDWLPADHPWWLREEGEKEQFWPGTHRMDWYNPDYRAHVVNQTKALQEVGIDGIFYDNLRDEREPWVALLKSVRQVVGDDFLILVNAGYETEGLEWVAPYLNGMMYESGWSHDRTEWDACIRNMQRVQDLLRPPKISVIERFEEVRDRAGWPGDPARGKPPKRDPAARRWSMCYALIVGDCYYLFSDNTSHRHDWYPEYDAKIGLAVGPGERVGSHVWRRQYQNALVVVNLPGATAPFAVKLEARARDAFTGEIGTAFAIPPGDGRILLRAE